MNERMLTGGLMAGFGTIAAVINAWAEHLFFALFHIARGESLEGAGSFDPGPYGVTPEATEIFIGTRLVIWLLIVLGLGLVLWELSDQYLSERMT
ncbi:MAG: hypothetical protein ABEI31_10170 [Halodesulfurarchaeum sp.]